MNTPRTAGLAITVLAAFPSGGVDAQPALPREIQQLFEESRAAMDRGEYADVCPKLERIVAAVPGGVGAKFALAECYEGLGKPARAHAVYVTAEQAAVAMNQPERIRFARAKIAELENQVCKLSLEIEDKAESAISVQIDGQSLTEATAVLDSGPHRVDAQADGLRPATMQLELKPAEQRTLRVDTTPGGDLIPYWTPLRVSAVVLWSSGAAATAVGAALGALAIDKMNQSERYCDALTDMCTDQLGVDLRGEARFAADGSTVGFALGAAAAAGGTLAFLLESPAVEPELPTIRIELAGAGQVRGTVQW